MTWDHQTLSALPAPLLSEQTSSSTHPPWWISTPSITMGINTDSKLSTSGVLNNLCTFLDYAAVSINLLTAECPLFAPFFSSRHLQHSAFLMPLQGWAGWTNPAIQSARTSPSTEDSPALQFLQKILPHFTFTEDSSVLHLLFHRTFQHQHHADDLVPLCKYSILSHSTVQRK